jgi:hypothetical protein
MIQVLIHRPLTTESGAQFPVNPRGIRGGLSYYGIGFSPATSVFPRESHFIAPHQFLRLRSMVYNHSNRKRLSIKHFFHLSTSKTICV